MKKKTTVGLLLFNSVTALADVDYKACWNIPLADENMFCYGAVTWQISEESYEKQAELDEKAKALYRELLFAWASRSNPDIDEPNNDCLAVAR